MEFRPYITTALRLRVHFAPAAGQLQTLEGPVAYAAGDAIVTGVAGEQWPVPADSFAAKYRPATDAQSPDRDGLFVKRPAIVQARQLLQATSVELSDGRGALAGQPGDWQIRYANGDQAIVAADLFDASYQQARVPLHFCADATLAGDADAAACLAALETALRNALPATPVCWLRGDGAVDAQAWFVVTRHAKAPDAPAERVLTLPLGTLCSSTTAPAELAGLIERGKRRLERGVAAFTWQKLHTLWRKLTASEVEAEHPALEVLAAQLVALDIFNGSIGKMDRGDRNFQPAADSFQSAWSGDAVPTPLQRFHRIGALADLRATQWQDRWQQLVFGTTRQLVGGGWRYTLRLLAPLSLVMLGLIAAVSLAAFTEIAEGCKEKERLFHWLGCHQPSWHDHAGTWMLSTYLLALLAACVLYARSQIEHIKDRHQDCRLLAECMRMQYVASVCCQPTPVSAAIPAAAHAPSGWVLSALRALTHRYAQPTAPPVSEVRLRWARQEFVGAQIAYHRDKLIGRRKTALHRFERLASLGAVLFLVTALAVAFDRLVLHYVPGAWPMLEFTRHLVIITMAGALAFWAAMRRVPEAFGWEAEAQRGVVVLDALLQAEQDLADPNLPLAQRAEALSTCGAVFIADQASWHALHRAKPIEAASGA